MNTTHGKLTASTYVVRNDNSTTICSGIAEQLQYWHIKIDLVLNKETNKYTSSTIPTFSHNEQVRFRFVAVKLLLLRPASVLQLVSDCISLSTFRVLCNKVSLATVMCPTAVYSWGLAIYHR
jgi:hypothetical protein